MKGDYVMIGKVGTNTTAAYTYGNDLLTRGGEMLHYDGHGTLRTATDATETITATQNWNAYGQLRGSSGSTGSPYRFGATSGYRNDGDGGVLHIGARWYDPAIGRWISAGPFLGFLHRPLSRNRYLYCEADPINEVDPLGLFSMSLNSAGSSTTSSIGPVGDGFGTEPGLPSDSGVKTDVLKTKFAFGTWIIISVVVKPDGKKVVKVTLKKETR